MKSLAAGLLSFFLLPGFVTGAELVTIQAAAAGAQNGSLPLTDGESFALGANEVALIQTMGASEEEFGFSYVYVDRNGARTILFGEVGKDSTNEFDFSAAEIPVTGPATLGVYADATDDGPGPPVASAEVTFIVMTRDEFVASKGFGGSGTGVPTGAVVIPVDADGPVEIRLEQSTDTITWTQAQPGTYGSGTTERFFRVRAVAQ